MGVPILFFMKVSWFKKHGNLKADKQDIQVSVWKLSR